MPRSPLNVLSILRVEMSKRNLMAALRKAAKSFILCNTGCMVVLVLLAVGGPLPPNLPERAAGKLSRVQADNHLTGLAAKKDIYLRTIVLNPGTLTLFDLLPRTEPGYSSSHRRRF